MCVCVCVYTRTHSSCSQIENCVNFQMTSNDLERLGYRGRSGNWVKPPEIAARDRLVRQFEVHESGPLRAVHLSRHKWPGGVVN